jgi:type I restriction enzyme S subunit
VQTGDIRHAISFVREYSQTFSEAGLSQSKLWPAATLCITIAANIAETAILGFDACFPDSIVGFQADESLASVGLVEYYFRTLQKKIERLAPATAQKNVNLDTLRNILVPVAPLNEQHRIIAKIDELFSDLDAAVAALERVKANLKRYRAAVLKAAVEGRLTADWRKKNQPKETGPQLLARILAERRCKWEEEQLAAFAKAGKSPPAKWKDKYKEPSGPDCTNLPALPEGWCWATVDQLIRYLRNGLSQKPSQVPPGYHILRINAVRPMPVDLREIRYYNKPENEVADCFIDDGDLLFTRYNGSIDLLGVSGMVRRCAERTLHPDKLIRVKTVIGHPLPEYLEIATNVGASRNHMQSRARTTAGQTGISGADIRESPVPLCSLVEQDEIVAEIERRLSIMQEAQSQVESNLKRSDCLRQCILIRAFGGKLVPQDPNDKPASVLLEETRRAHQATGHNQSACSTCGASKGHLKELAQ